MRQVLLAKSDGLTDWVRQDISTPSKANLLGVVSGRKRQLERHQFLCRQGDAATEIFVILSGALKAVRLSNSGEEDIIRFYLPGEILWSDGLMGEERALSIIAASPTTVHAMSCAQLQFLMHNDANVSRRCFNLLSRQLREGRRFNMMLAKGSAQQRAAFFLLEVAKRLPAESRGDGPLQICLPMTRTDIANYISLSVETLSRTFTHLQTLGIIKIRARLVELMDMERLEAIANGHS